MPIEINEIAIQLQVRDDSDGPAARPAAQAAAPRGEDREAIVADCVARVLRVLKMQRER
jgi:hypothetical protein